MGRSYLLLASILALAARAALATTADQVPCLNSSPPPMPCVVDDGTFTVDPASTLDFGSRGLTITGHGQIDARGGALTILAQSLDVQPGGLITSAGSDISVTTTGDINIEAVGSTRGRFDVSGPSGGSVTFVAGGNLTIAGQLLGTNTVSSGDGGSIDVTGTNVNVTGLLRVRGGTTGFGGDISVSAVLGSMTISGTLDASGGDGGTISLDADGDVSVAGASVLDGSAGAAGSGDTIDVTSYGASVSLAGTIRGGAPGDLVNGGGSGADFCADASTTITNNAAIDVSGGGQNGLGGTVELTTDGDIIQRGTMNVSAEGAGGFSGLISFSTTQGMVDIAGGAFTADGPGAGGDISAFSYNGVSVANRITADGPNASIALQGCAVTVPAGGRLSSVGAAGVNTIQASGLMTIAGTLLADPTRVCSNDATITCNVDSNCHVCQANHLQACSGPADCGGDVCDTAGTCTSGNLLQYRDPTLPPILTGSTISPSAVQVVTPTLTPCGGPPTTTTSTTTTSTTTIGTNPTTTATTTTATTSTMIVVPTTTTTATIPTTTTSTTATTTVTTATTTTSVPVTTSTTQRTPSTTTTSNTTTTTLGQPAVCDPPDCRDGNSCTDDSCGADGICVHDDRTGFDAVTCKLDDLVQVLAAAPVGDVGGAGLRGKFQATVTKIHGMIDAGRAASGKRQVVKLKRANKAITVFIHTVVKGEHRGKVKTGVGGQITDLAGGAQSKLQPFLI